MPMQNQKNLAPEQAEKTEDLPVSGQTLTTLETGIDLALQKGTPRQFRDLIKKYGRMVNQLKSRINSPQSSREALLKSVEKYREWTKTARQQLKDIRDKTDNLQALKNTRRQLSSAYSAQASKAGKLISRKG